jgi:putative flippase GtrA
VCTGILESAGTTSSQVPDLGDAQRPALDGPTDLNGRPEDRQTALTVIIPTRDESADIGSLLIRLASALAPVRAEILVVDDSDAGDTAVELARHARACPVPVRLLRRPAGQRSGGPGGVVAAGLRHATGDWALVMDGYLQHPPEAAVALVRTAMRHEVDIVIGTSCAAGGSSGGPADTGRLMTSSAAIRLAKTMFPRRLATVTDPMSGLFAVRVGAVDIDRLNPLGSTVLLELLVRHPGARVAEFAYEMQPRHAGAPRVTIQQGLTFLRHLTRLRRQRLVNQLQDRPLTPRDRLRELGRMVAFGLVGLSGVAVNTAALWLCYSPLGMHHLLAAVLATQASTTWNFLLIDRLVYRGGGAGSLIGRGARFYLMNNALLLARLPLLQLLVWSHMAVLAANAVTLLLLFAVRFLVSDRVIYGGGREGGRDPVKVLVDSATPTAVATGATNRKRSQYLKYRYDVAGTVTIGSQIVLPELEFFRAQWVADADVDIAVRVGDVGRRTPRRRARMTELSNPATLRYEEHLGRFGANFRLELGHPITIEVGPLLARSPHVVYTNIVEALLRFVMVSRGKMLLHSACLSVGGTGVMLSALTDTGKTATVLRLLRDHGGLFLSDDMTVVDASGTALCFPKPLTISAHTLRAVQADDLTPAEWRRLQMQSRLHSRGGRSLALALSRFNVPIMGINAITQMLVPPPKYSVDRLVPCRLGGSTRVDELFIIERGAPRVAALDAQTTLERMIANTDDAYGFPPFRYLAPAITIGGAGYADLRAREREILAGFLSRVRTRVIASDCYGWADEIPQLISRSEPDAGAGDRDGAQPRPHWTQIDAFPRWHGRLAPSGGAAR